MKRIAVVVALVCLATVGFAGDLSFGIGASGSYFSSDTKLTSAGISQDVTTTEIPYNLFVYVESTNLQLAVGYRTFDGMTVKGQGGTSEVSAKYSYLSLAGYGKFPLHLGSVVLIPMIGVEYDVTLDATLSGVSADSQTLSDLNALWIKAGLGAEIPLSPSFYFRPEFLFGYQLNNQFDRDLVNIYKGMGFDDASILELNFELALLFGVKL